DRNQAVIYRGPFESIMDDDGRHYVRGQRTAVCHRTFATLMSEPYQGQFIAVEPKSAIALESAPEFDCTVDQLRPPQATKGGVVKLQISEGVSDKEGDCCGGDSCC
ncbi:MAG: methyltransferase, partial [Pirellulaceae bacterium]|nr:methyltransferase [Pirellulaceae bacterium]